MRSSRPWGWTAKIRLTELARAHLDTLSVERHERGQRDDRRSVADLALFFLLPLAVGAAVWGTGVSAPDVDPLLASISILTGLLFALIVLVFDRLIQVRAQQPPAVGNDPVVDAWQLLVNISWAILVSLTLLVVLFTTVLLRTDALPPWLTAIVAALGLHLVLTLLMVLKRVFYMAKRIAGHRADPGYRH
ncbi:hypothetical protein [Blastococcus xanthinilyticus]|uniref:Transmembrane protein n=1 Tax=Blastococcus xanthinilyticus TaxID=1564164 RepID=A0A5S5CPX7_9ACTN|nr:hypothetical protein [Blastococcus xanthinilyticus]TYP82899.1 hypothetical protein BD833_11731 [Blastococcus xanthinilyticus]